MRYLLLTGAALLFTASQLIFGGVHVHTLCPIQAAIFLLASLATLTSLPRPEQLASALPWLLLAMLALIQITPLPGDAVRFLSPEAHQAALEVGSLSAPDCGWIKLSMAPYQTKTALLGVLSALAFLFILLQAFRAGTPPMAGAWILLFMGLFQVGYGMIQTYGPEQKIWWWVQEFPQYRGYLTGTYINKNHLADFLGLSAPMCFGAALSYMEHQKKKTAFAFITGGLVLVTGLLLTGSRGGILSFALATVPAIALFRAKAGARFPALAMAAALVLCTAMAWFGLGSESRHALDESFRPELWKAVLPMIRDFPLTGAGLGAFNQSAYPYLPPSMSGATPPLYAHNDWLQLVLETGLPGMALFLAGTLLFVRSYAGRWFKSDDPTAKGLGLGMFWALAYMAAHSFFDFNLHIPANAFTLLFVIALGMSSLEKKTKKPASSRILRITLAVAIACLWLACIQPVAAQYLANRLCPTGIDSTSTKTLAPEPPEMAKAAVLTPWNARLHAKLAAHYMRAGTQNPALSELAVRSLTSALKHEPANGWYWYHLGSLLPEEDRADRCMELAQKYRPRDSRLLYLLGEYWVLSAAKAKNRAKREKAVHSFTAIFRQAVKWDRGDWKTGNWRRAAIAIWKSLPNPSLVRGVVPPTDDKARHYFDAWLKLRPVYGNHH